MNQPQVNREGLTYEEFLCAAKPAEEADHGYIRTRVKLTPQEISERRMKVGPNYPAITHAYGSKTRDAYAVLRRAWSKGEDPTEWRAWAEEQRRNA
jgi:hypothetical protein